jgi:hypothetical protein
MPSDESFVFGPGKNEHIADKQFIQKVCNGVNYSFKRNQISWRIRYSINQKVFVVEPYDRMKRVRKIKSVSRPPSEVEERGFTEDTESRLQTLVLLMKKTFNLTMKDLQKKGVTGDLVDYKRAMLYVGRNGLGLKLSEIGNFLGLSSASTSTLSVQAMNKPAAKEKTALLMAALNKGGEV